MTPVQIYRLLVILAGYGWLLYELARPREPLPWLVVAVFVLLSWLVKRAGFRVVAEVTHSLVNVVDVGALLVLGPLGGALVAGLSSIFHMQFSAYRRRSRAWSDWVTLPLFDGGVKCQLALLGGAVYLQAGGELAPTALTLTLFWPLTLLYLLWFSLDHLFWIGHFFYSGGARLARRFRQRIGNASLIIELAPLPFSAPLAIAWGLFDPALRLFLMLSIILIALVVRAFALALKQTEERVKTVSLLNKFGQSLVMAQLEESKLAALLFEYAGQLLPDTHFELVLLDSEGEHYRALLPSPERESTVRELMPLILPMFAERPRGRLLPTLTRWALEEEAQRSPEERPQRGSVLLMPLVSGDLLLGIFVAESMTPGVLTLDDGRSLSVLATQAAVALQNARNFRQERWRARQLATIAEVSRMVASVPNLEEFLRNVVELVRSNFAYYHVQIYLVEPDGTHISFRAGSGEAGKLLADLPLRLKIGEQGIIGWVAGHGEPLLVNDVSEEPRYVPEPRHILPHTRAEMAVPLKIEERVLGVLDVQSDDVGDLDEDDLFTMTTLADQIAVAIEDARLYVAQREEAWVTSSLLKLSSALNPLFELPHVLRTIVQLVPNLLGADAAAIYLWRQDDRLFEGVASHGLPPAVTEAFKGYRLKPVQFPLLDKIREKNQLLAIDQAACSRLVPEPFSDQIGEMGLIAVPLQAQGGFVGVLLVGSHGGLNALSNRRKMLFLGIAQQAAVAIQAATLFAAQQEEAAITSDLLRMAEMIASRTELQEILEVVTRLAVTMADVEQCVVYLWENEGERLLPAEAYGLAPEIEVAWRGGHLAARDVGCLTLLWDATEPVVLGREGHPTGCPAIESLFKQDSLVAMPLRAHNQFLGIIFLDLPRPRGTLPQRQRIVLTGIARQLSVALENYLLLEEALENERRSQELALARQIQSALLPDRPPELEGYDIAGYWRPAREVAGDFYDYLQLSRNRLAISIADVADKGMGAALFMVLTRTALRESLWSEEDAGRALERTSAIISSDVRGGMFLTIFLAILSPLSGHIQAANAGHLPPLHYRHETDSLSMAARRNMPLAILPDTRYDSFELMLMPGDFLVLVTDGLMDVMDPARQILGLQRIAEQVYRCRHMSARAIINEILNAASAHAAGEPFDDDVTIVVVKRKLAAADGG